MPAILPPEDVYDYLKTVRAIALSWRDCNDTSIENRRMWPEGMIDPRLMHAIGHDQVTTPNDRWHLMDLAIQRFNAADRVAWELLK